MTTATPSPQPNPGSPAPIPQPQPGCPAPIPHLDYPPQPSG